MSGGVALLLTRRDQTTEGHPRGQGGGGGGDAGADAAQAAQGVRRGSLEASGAAAAGRVCMLLLAPVWAPLLPLFYLAHANGDAGMFLHNRTSRAYPLLYLGLRLLAQCAAGALFLGAQDWHVDNDY